MSPVGETAAHTPGSCEISASHWNGWGLAGASALPRAFKTQNAQGFGTFLKQEINCGLSAQGSGFFYSAVQGSSWGFLLLKPT